MVRKETTVNRRVILSLLVTSLAFLSACSDDSSTAQDAGNDGSTDTAADMVLDTAKDTAKDSQKDVTSDALPDGGSDVAQDSDRDSDSDAQDLDVQPDTNPDVTPDAEQDVEQDVDSGMDADDADDADDANDADVYDGDVVLDADAQLCPDTCLSITLMARFGANTVKFERAFFGLDTEEGGQKLYLEAYEGGSSTCPESTSPTPHFTLIVSGWPLNKSQVTYEEGLRVVLFDFTGTVLDPVPIAKATGATAKRVNACVDCAPWPTVAEHDTHVYIDIDAQFDGGEVKGQINASHCDSLD